MPRNAGGSDDQARTQSTTDSYGRRTLLGVLGAGSISLAGCLSGAGDETSTEGDDSDSTDMDGDATTTDDETTTTEAGMDEADTTTASDETTTEDPDTTSGGDGDVNCADLESSGYSRYDEADSPFVATFEHPGDVSATIGSTTSPSSNCPERKSRPPPRKATSWDCSR